MSVLKIKKSYTKKIFDFIFAPKEIANFRSSLLWRFFSRFEKEKLGRICLLVALILIIYEGLINQFFSLVDSPLPLIMVFLSLIFLKKEKLVLGKPFLWLIIFTIWVLVSGIASVLMGLNPKISFLGVLIYFQFTLAFSVGMLAFKKINLLKILNWLSLPLVFVGLVQFFGGATAAQFWAGEGEGIVTRAYGFFGSPNIYGIFFALIILGNLLIWAKGKQKTYLALGIFYLLPLILSFSRTAWLALALALILLIGTCRKKLLVAFPLVAVLALFFSQIRERIGAIFSATYLTDSTLDGRLWSLTNGWHIFLNNWRFGTGPGSYGGLTALSYASPVYLAGIQNGYTALYYTDNQWLEILVQLGIVGFLLFLVFIIALLYSFFKLYKLKKDIMFLGGASFLVIIITAGALANIIEFSSLAVPGGLILGAIINEN